MQQGTGRGVSPDVTEPPRLLPDRWWGKEGRIGATVHCGARASESSGIGGQGGLGVMRCGDSRRVWLEAWPRCSSPNYLCLNLNDIVVEF